MIKLSIINFWWRHSFNEVHDEYRSVAEADWNTEVHDDYRSVAEADSNIEVHDDYRSVAEADSQLIFKSICFTDIWGLATHQILIG